MEALTTSSCLPPFHIGKLMRMCEQKIPKENAVIAWKYNRLGQIDEVIVYHSSDPPHDKKKYSSDDGAYHSDWLTSRSRQPEALLIDLLSGYQFESEEVKRDLVLQMGKIEG